MATATTLGLELDARLSRLWRGIGRYGKGVGELSRTAASVLAQLRDGGPQRITALAAAEALAQPTITTLVGRLERAGLVERIPDPDDARAVRGRITDEGLARLEAMRAVRAELLERRLGRLSGQERETLAAALPVLDKLIEGD